MWSQPPILQAHSAFCNACATTWGLSSYQVHDECNKSSQDDPYVENDEDNMLLGDGISSSCKDIKGLQSK